MPAFLQTSPFTSKLFRATIEKLADERHTVRVHGQPRALSAIAHEWLHHELAGARLRMAHRCIEWDGWEEGLVGSILGPEEQAEDWFKTWEEPDAPSRGDAGADEDALALEGGESPEPSDSPVAAISVESLALSSTAASSESEASGA